MLPKNNELTNARLLYDPGVIDFSSDWLNIEGYPSLAIRKNGFISKLW
jgi:hypothetical protein